MRTSLEWNELIDPDHLYCMAHIIERKIHQDE